MLLRLRDEYHALEWQAPAELRRALLVSGPEAVARRTDRHRLMLGGISCATLQMANIMMLRNNLLLTNNLISERVHLLPV